MKERLAARKIALHAMMPVVAWIVMPMGLLVAYGQPVQPSPAPADPVPVQSVPPQSVPGQPSPTVTPAEAQGAREADQVKQAEGARAAEPEVKTQRIQLRPSETYVAGFGGYTFGGKFNNLEGTGLLSGLNLNDRDLAQSGVYGGKVGHFFRDRLDWLGVEMEAFNTTPHVEQQGPVPGSHFRVTTLAFNFIGRVKLGCEMKTVRTEPRSRREGVRYETLYEREFCRIQPYAGVGIGVFFANFSTNGTSVSDNAVPGLNALAGLRFYFNERIALFGEYKYNYAVFDASTNGPVGGVAGFKGDYRANHVVGGLSFHF